MAEQAGSEERLQRLPASGGSPGRLRVVVEFEASRAELEAALPRADRSQGVFEVSDHCCHHWNRLVDQSGGQLLS